MWLKYEGIEFKRGLTAKSGKKYDAWVLKGQRKGFDGAPDTPYEKHFSTTLLRLWWRKVLIDRALELFRFSVTVAMLVTLL